MPKKYIVWCALVVFTAVPLASMQGPDGKTIVNAAVKAMGAENLKTLQFSGSGSNAAIGQNIHPERAWPMVRVKSYTRQIDLESIASSVQAVRIQNNAETPQAQAIPPNAAWAQQSDIWVTPYAFLKGATANPVTVRSETVNGVKYNIVTFALQNRYKVEGYINPQNMVERVHTWVDNNVMADMLVEGIYTEYKDFGGVKVPALQIVKQGGFPTLILSVNDAKANVPVTITSAAAPPAPAAAAVAVETEKIAEGVYYLKGGTHHSVLVEFADHLSLIEAPQNEARSLALLAEIKRLYASKPLTEVVNTHHHFDHSGGLRTFVDAGAAIVTHESNVPFYEKTFAAPRTLNPDRLEQSKRKANIVPVADKMVMRDATRTMELHLIKNNSHNEGILAAYLPSEKILVQVDLYTPLAAGATVPAANAPAILNATALLENLERLRLDFETIVPLHGAGSVARSGLYAFVGKPLVAVSALPDPAAATAGARGGGRGARGGGGANPDAAVEAIVNTSCNACHSLDRINAKKADREDWTATVRRMRSKGADLPEDQIPLVIEYLARTRGPQ